MIRSASNVICGVWNKQEKIGRMYHLLAINLRLASPCIYSLVSHGAREMVTVFSVTFFSNCS